MNKKIKKTLKWTGIVVVSGLGGALIVSPEFRGVVMKNAQTGFNTVMGLFTEEKKSEAPKREGRNNGGYYKPRYNNKKN